MTSGPWVTPAQVRATRIWPDAANMRDEELLPLIAAASDQCDAYAPLPAAYRDPVTGIPVPSLVPDRLHVAVITQARELWVAMRRGDGDMIVGPDGLAVRARPLIATVRALLRPIVAIPTVG